MSVKIVSILARISVLTRISAILVTIVNLLYWAWTMQNGYFDTAFKILGGSITVCAIQAWAIDYLWRTLFQILRSRS